MAALLSRCGIRLSRRQLDQLWQYHQLLRSHDAELNLTRIRNFENMVVKLYADSMLPALQGVSLPSPLLDLGSGPGMPGIPLKIFQPDLHLFLADSRQNRTDFLKIVVAELALPGMEVVDRGIAPDYDRAVAGVITRAVEPIGDTLARVSGCLVKAGRVFFMKGPRCDAEIQAARAAFIDTHELSDDIAYRIPHTPHQRRLVIFRSKVEPKRPGPAPIRHRVKPIESDNNVVYKNLRKLLGSRGIKKQGQTLVCGGRLVSEALHQFPRRCRAWISSGDKPPPATAPASLEWLQLTPELFRTLDIFGTRQPMVLFDAPAPPVWLPADPLQEGCSLLVPFQDPENVGAVIRTAVALSVDRVILLAESANPFHHKAVRASSGTVFAAPLFQGPSMTDLPPHLPVIALSASGRPLDQTSFPQRFCLLPGMEGPGLPAQWQADTASIPMSPGVDSLNAAVATAIALYEWRRKK
ncbi:MAG TPA: RsmG family class I SAM-dependent methyltransferase [Desulfosarcina sp.]|nr:RsmG family class I SAM-dependent methyltransferase [Desulfosarcina sp.]